VELKLAATKNESTTLLADAERRAQHLVDEAKPRTALLKKPTKLWLLHVSRLNKKR
jgi:F0F1-type ATP synthase membrane subunit b/b'